MADRIGGLEPTIIYRVSGAENFHVIVAGFESTPGAQISVHYGSTSR
jgi:hypothetical protein